MLEIGPADARPTLPGHFLGGFPSPLSAQPTPCCLFQLRVAEKSTNQVTRAVALSLPNQTLATKWGYRQVEA